MSLLYRIVYAAHANGTHHKLALDALRHVTVGPPEAWQRLFLLHAEGYLKGSKDPDNAFKDFKNHVLHVGDRYWGGAIGKVEEWYGTTVRHLAAEQWADAVYAAGVLSHYYTDPIHPFHTAQSEAENSIHRAAEWSINRSYDDLARIGEASPRRVAVVAKDGEGWLRDLVCAGAELSHAQYEKLIAHYDIHKGVVDPPLGLDGIAQAVVADLIDYAGRSFAVILDRAFMDAKVEPPSVSLTLQTILATVKIPQKRLAKRLANVEDRRIVEAMYDELKATGRVEASLPEDDRVVRDLYATEVLAPKLETRDAQRAALVGRVIAPPAKPASKPAPLHAPDVAAAPLSGLAPKPAAPGHAPVVPPAPKALVVAAPPVPATPSPPQPSLAARLDRGAASTNSESMSDRGAVGRPAAVDAPAVKPAAVVPSVPSVGSSPGAPVATGTPSPVTTSVRPTPSGPAVPATAPAIPVAVPSQPVAAKPVAPASPAVSAKPAATTIPPQAVAKPVVAAVVPAAERPQREARLYLAASDPLEAAPSIGPKGAERFASFGIKTVGDFLAGDPKVVAAKLAVPQVTPEVIASWQAQARLVMTIPGLRGTHAQLLVGAGYRAAQAIAAADSEAVCAAVLKYATSPDGQRLLRDGAPPDVERIKTWCDSARQAVAA